MVTLLPLLKNGLVEGEVSCGVEGTLEFLFHTKFIDGDTLPAASVWFREY